MVEYKYYTSDSNLKKASGIMTRREFNHARCLNVGVSLLCCVLMLEPWFKFHHTTAPWPDQLDAFGSFCRLDKLIGLKIWLSVPFCSHAWNPCRKHTRCEHKHMLLTAYNPLARVIKRTQWQITRMEEVVWGLHNVYSEIMHLICFFPCTVMPWITIWTPSINTLISSHILPIEMNRNAFQPHRAPQKTAPVIFFRI